MASRRTFVLASGSAVVATGLLAVPAGCRGKIYPGTVIFDTVDLGGMTRAQAETLVNTRLASFQSNAITFRHEALTWSASLADIGATVDVNTFLDAAERRGRRSGFIGRYTTWFDGSDDAEAIAIPMAIDGTTLRAFLQRIAAEVNVSPSNASLVQSGLELKIEVDRPGLSLDLVAAEHQVRALLADLKPATLDLPTAPVAPTVTANDLAPFRNEAAALISKPVMIVDDTHGGSWTIDPMDLAQALVLPDTNVSASGAGPSLDSRVLRDAVVTIAEELWFAPVNATVGWDNGPYIVTEAVTGRKVDAAALAESVARAASTESRVAMVPVTDIPADVSAETLPGLGLDAVLGAGDSSFAGSSEARAENVVVAANHIAGTLIAPGEQFSFNQALGPITVENGYVEGKIIKGDWYASDLGGGVCQVSTTVYRAALYAGMQFDEWHAHSFRVSFYELDGWPPGIDAAIYQPNSPDEWEMDLTFTNTSDAWMLLQMTENSGHITAQVIGKPTGNTVSLDTPTLGDPLPPTAPQERTTDALPSGQRHKIQDAAPGVVVTLTRTFSKDGAVTDQDTFTSEYAAQPEIWEVGAGSTSASD